MVDVVPGDYVITAWEFSNEPYYFLESADYTKRVTVKEDLIVGLHYVKNSTLEVKANVPGYFDLLVGDPKFYWPDDGGYSGHGEIMLLCDVTSFDMFLNFLSDMYRTPKSASIGQSRKNQAPAQINPFNKNYAFSPQHTTVLSIGCTVPFGTYSVRPGNYWIKFNPLPGWQTPSGQFVRIATGETTVYGIYRESYYPLAGYTYSSGWLPISQGRWKITEPKGFENLVFKHGEMVELREGTAYTVVFMDVTGYKTPTPESVSGIAGSSSSPIGIYSPSFHNITVTIGPAEANHAGAYWSEIVSSPTLQIKSGETIQIQDAQPYSITFAKLKEYVPGFNDSYWEDGYWLAPSDVSGTMENADLNITVSYVQIMHNSQISVTPPEAVAAGAAFMLENLYDSWETDKTYSLPHKTQVRVAFRAATGWTAPAPADLILDQDNTYDFKYTRKMAGLSIIAYPSTLPRSDSGETRAWKLSTGTMETAWMSFDQSVTLTEGTQYQIVFKDAANGYATPGVISGTMTGATCCEYASYLPNAKWSLVKKDLPFYEYLLLDPDSFTVVTSNAVYHSNDSGNTWNLVASGSFTNLSNSIYFYQGQAYYATNRYQPWTGNLEFVLGQVGYTPSYHPAYGDMSLSMEHFGTPSDFYLHGICNDQSDSMHCNQYGLLHTTDFITYRYAGLPIEGLEHAALNCRFGSHGWYEYSPTGITPLWNDTAPDKASFSAGDHGLVTYVNYNHFYRVTSFESNKQHGYRQDISAISAGPAISGSMTRADGNISLVTQGHSNYSVPIPARLYRLQEQAQYSPVSVNIGPSGALQSGAGWRLKGEPRWRQSGGTVTVPDGSNFDIEFREVEGWNKPAAVSVSKEHEAVNLNVAYIEQPRINVQLYPQEGMWQFTNEPAGHWRASGSAYIGKFAAAWGNSNYINIRFKELPGYIAPVAQSLNIGSGSGEVELHYSYSHRRTLAVHIEPQDAIDNGVQWYVYGQTGFLNSDQTIEVFEGSTYCIAGTTISARIPGLRDPDPLTFDCKITADTPLTAVCNLVYRPDYCTIEVVIVPDFWSTIGGWKLAGEEGWRINGDKIKVRKGINTVVLFNKVDGAIEQKPISDVYFHDTTIYGQYSTKLQILQVSLTPEVVVEKGGWKLADEYYWRKSGDSIELEVGTTFEVQFCEVSGNYKKPDNIIGTMEIGTCSYIGQYQTKETAQCKLVMLITPETLLFSDIGWRFKEESEWRPFYGYVLRDENSTYELEFKTIPGWVSPGAVKGTITEDTVQVMLYSPAYHELTVKLSPDKACSAGAQWQLSGEESWHNSDDSVEVREGTVYKILFKTVYGWTKPLEDSGVIWNDTDFTGNYTLAGKSVSIDIWPEAAQSEMFWKLTTSQDWNRSGTYLNLPLGSTFEIEFSSSNSWLTPHTIKGCVGSSGWTGRVNCIARDFDWKCQNSYSNFEGRSHQTAVTFDDKLWIIGGLQGTRELADVWNSTDGMIWSRVTDNSAFGPRYSHLARVFNGKIWVIGGISNGTEENSVWCSGDGSAWTQANPDPGFSPRSGLSGDVFNGKLWVIGGRSSTNELKDIWNTADGINWTLVDDQPEFGRGEDRACVAYDGKLWLIGGIVDNSPTTEVWSSADGIDWQLVTSSAPFLPRYGHSVVVMNKALWLIGGLGFDENGSYVSNDVWYSFDGISWKKPWNNPGFGYRYYHASAVFKNKLWLIGGNDLQNDRNDVWSGDGIYHNLTVVLDPSAAVTSGASWKMPSDSSWRSSGTSVKIAENNGYTMELRTIQRWIEPALVLGGIGETDTTVELSYLPKMHALTVNLSPQGAVGDGAQWKLSSGSWHNSGDSVEIWEGSTYTIIYKNDIPGWSSPINYGTFMGESDEIIYGSYQAALRYLTINLTPAEAVTQGAGWRLAGESVYRSSGNSTPVQETKGFQLEFAPLYGWISPVLSSIMPCADQALTATFLPVNYRLTVNITPEIAIAGGAQWMLSDGSNWCNSGDSVEIREGAEFTVIYKNQIYGFRNPSNFSDTMAENDTTISGTYEAALHNLTLNLSPAEVVNQGAGWKLAGESAYHNSGDSVPVQEADYYHVDFSPLYGWISPALNGTMPDTDQVFTTVYFPINHDLIVSVTPEAAVAAGAKWRLSSDQFWRSSFTTVPVRQGSSFEIVLSQAPEWVAQANVTGVMGESETTETVVFTKNIWDSITNETFSARYGQASAVFDEKLWISGGCDGVNLLNDVVCSSDGLVWQCATPGAAFCPRYGHTLTTFQDKLWLIGGKTSLTLSDIWSSSDGITWECSTTEAVFGPRYGQSVLSFAGKIWLIGGNDGSGPKNDVWYSEDGADWQLATAEATFCPRWGQAACVHSEKMWISSGNSGLSLLSDVWYSDDGVNWIEATDNAAFSPRQFASCISFNNEIWLAGGVLNPTFTEYDGAYYHSQNGTDWVKENDNEMNSARASYSLNLFQNKVWIAAGLKQGLPSSDVLYSRVPSVYHQMTVNITPADAIAAGAMWKLAGESTWRKSGTYVLLKEGDNYSITCNNVTGYCRYEDIVGSVGTSDFTVPADYSTVYHTLIVQLGPQGALNAGASWRLNGETDWRVTGSGVQIQEGSTRTVELLAVNCWKTPADFAFTMNGSDTTIQKEYSPYHYLTISLGPTEAVQNGGAWRLSGESDWRSSETSVLILESNTTTVELRTLAEWDAPADFAFYMNDSDVSINKNYAPYHHLKINLGPSAAVQDGGAWRLSGESDWRSSETSILILEGNSTTVELKTLEWWNTPADFAYTMGDSDETIDKDYSFYRNLTINLGPADAVQDGASWRLSGESAWRNSETSVQLPDNLAVTVELKTIDFWNAPEGFSTYLAGADLSLDKTYTPISHKLTVFTGPDNLPEGSGWKLSGETEWRESGSIAQVQEGKEFNIIFNDIDCWIIPAPITETMENSDLIKKADYLPIYHNLTINITPQDAIDSGAGWKLYTDTVFRNSGDSVQIQEGQSYTVQFKGELTGWNKPDDITNVMGNLDVSSEVAYTGIYHLLSVSLEPPQAVGEGAQWKLSSDETWRNGNEQISLQEGNTYEIEFQTIPGWEKPGNIYSTVFDTDDVKVESYESIQHNLTVNINPEKAVNAGAQWRLAGEIEWRESGTSVEIQESKSFHIEFNQPFGWIAPQEIIGFMGDADTLESGEYEAVCRDLWVNTLPDD
ncbi:MAG: hypothetical protein PHW04_08660, partial [Candidatus Wallbacteria bacterium]|nr:hypothetical protein [Candidatus Wallbacteria bacterium]